ncbi:hypothetical protein [Mycobacteroides salmoniphilum]|uniref:hypothetical protein n=1 Tax=Mycobacteroides salmoniphilum TaxID=404941 RepID=UPI00099410D4|nr:hypothetical protein [Mycobacteroides salmoniphilum]
MFTYLLALNPTEQKILKVDVAKGDSTTLIDGLTSVPDGIVVDPQREHIYWTNMGYPTLPEGRAPRVEADLDFYRKNGSIERARIDGTGRSHVLPEGAFVTGKQLAGAWAQDRLYWSDREGAAVRSARLDGTDLREEIVTATTDADRRLVRNQCVGIAIDEDQGLLYWTQKGPPKGNDGRIFRTSLNAPVDDRPIEVLWSGLPEPIDLELDTASGLIFWTDRGAAPLGNTLNKATIPALGEPGREVTVLSQNFHEAIGLAIDKEAGIAYVSDLSGEIRAIDFIRGREHQLLKAAGGFTGIVGL